MTGWRNRDAGLLLLVGALVLFLGRPPATGVRLAHAQALPCDVADADRTLNDAESRMTELINAYRAGLGLGALQTSPTLLRETRWKGAALAAGGDRPVSLSDHDDGSRRWDQRFLDCGYPESAEFAENLGSTNAPVEALLDAWKRSPTHDTNLRNPNWSYFGIARVPVSGDAAFWATAFGTDPR